MISSTLFEINNHKNKISDLSKKFLNTFNIQEEFSLINEFKKEIEILVQLLNIKNNMLNFQQNPMQNINNQLFMPMLNQSNNCINNNFINNSFISNNQSQIPQISQQQNCIINNQFPQNPQQQIQNQIQQQMMMQQMQMQMQMQQQQMMMQQLSQQDQMKNALNNSLQNNINNFQTQIQKEEISNNIINENEDNKIENKFTNNEEQINYEQTKVYLDEMNIIFKPIGENEEPLESIVVKCRPNDLVAYIIEQYRKKSGDKSRYKKFIFENFNLFPGMKIADSGLYNGAEIYVYKNND